MSTQSIIGTLIRTFNLQNVKIPDVRNNPYDSGTVNFGYQTPDETRASLMAGMGGIPVFVDLTLKGGFYKDNITNKTINFQDVKFEAVIMTVDKVARIVKTEIQGRDGTVKEYIGKDDSKITIQGVITGPNGIYPQSEVKNLINWWNAPIAKSVECSYLQMMDINYLVCEDLSLPQVAGGYSYQTFSINAISDMPVELIIK